MAGTFRCSIVTPTGSPFDGEAMYASFPAWDGQHGMMPGKSPLLTQLGTGSLRIDLPNGGSEWFLIDGGFAQADPTQLVLITDSAMSAKDMTFEQAEAELADVTVKVLEAGTDQEQIRRDQERAYAKRALAAKK